MFDQGLISEIQCGHEAATRDRRIGRMESAKYFSKWFPFLNEHSRPSTCKGFLQQRAAEGYDWSNLAKDIDDLVGEI
jgi:hypothetical protein